MRRAPLHNTTRRRAFTLIELLVVVIIIGLLIGLLVAAFGGILRNARRASTQATVTSLGQGVEAFRNDFDSRVPPLITRHAAASNPGFTNGVGGLNGSIVVPSVFQTRDEREIEAREAGYHSVFTLATYLIGEGDLNGDGIETYSEPGNEEPNLDDGLDGPGFRDPGRLLAWKRPDPNNPSALPRHAPAQTGRVFGPYLESGIEGSVERVEVADGVFMSQFVDSFGNPIRFYRDYPTRIPGNSDGSTSTAFMPQELRSIRSVKEILTERYVDIPPDPSSGADVLETQQFNALEREVIGADYVILAAGDDPTRWIDEDGEGVAPFGDVILNGNLERVNLMEWDEPEPTFFGPDVTSEEVRVNMWTSMIESNVRFTP